MLVQRLAQHWVERYGLPSCGLFGAENTPRPAALFFLVRSVTECHSALRPVVLWPVRRGETGRGIHLR
jgi:hypothetical protein